MAKATLVLISALQLARCCIESPVQIWTVSFSKTMKEALARLFS